MWAENELRRDIDMIKQLIKCAKILAGLDKAYVHRNGNILD